MKERNSSAYALLVALGSSFLFAYFYAVIVSIVDADDYADLFVDLEIHQTRTYWPPAMFHPFIFIFMNVVAFISGFVAWPFVYLLLQNREAKKCLPWLIGMTAAWILTASVILSTNHGWFGAYVVFIVTVIALMLFVPRIPPEGFCQKCGYDLTGNISGRCPECGQAINLPEPKNEIA